jgi:hypothetical protein
VEDLTLEHEVHNQSSEEHNEVDRTQWRNLLRSFSKVKTLRIDHGLVGDLSRCLQLDDGEPPLELLPKMRALTISGSGYADNAFTSFIDAHQNAGQPVTLARSQVTSDSPSSSAPVITPGSNEAGNVLNS